MDQLRMALELAYEKHKDQVDKSGKPYFLHPIYVAYNEHIKGKAKIVAILHDIIEDTDVTEEMLLEMGFDKDIVEAIVLLTRDKAVDYFSYVRQIRDSNNPYAYWVKLSDLENNMDLSRLEYVKDEDIKRVAKYKKALDIFHKKSE
ncbi:HD domain-containing protein [Cellulosilyticum ruminicola]|uniref:HD domain-containing protein n=1 Tax=Cellulosilyticum ruminicola TaxID=425254 RepID=UPI0006D2C27B|nr:HD domain-containing protein [Cellulosilyticum ruminicola]